MSSALLGLMGYAQAGKDTVAKLLVEEFGFTRIAFADALREALYALNPLIPFEGDHVRLRWLIDASGWEEAKVRHPEVRELLQRLGTESGRNVLGADVWV